MSSAPTPAATQHATPHGAACTVCNPTGRPEPMWPLCLVLDCGREVAPESVCYCPEHLAAVIAEARHG